MESASFVERRKHKRYDVNLSATVKILISSSILPFEGNDSIIRDISRCGCGLLITTEVLPRQEELAKVFTRRRRCMVFCRFPNSTHTTSLHGELIWAEPRLADCGMRIRFGISIEDSEPAELREVKEFIDGLEGRSHRA
jgi:hypothetical protein